MDGFDILLNRRLKIGRREDFNDPFELVFGVDEKTTYDNIKREYKDNPTIINEWKKQLQLDTQNSIEEIIKKVAQFNMTQLDKTLRTYWETIGIICLSESPDIIQMWGHYTDNHKGIVIGIDENQFVGNPDILVDICYRDKMVLLPVTATREGIKQYEPYIKELIKRKETNWQYEKEVRIYGRLNKKDEDGNYYSKILPSSITELYLGLRSNKSTEKKAKLIKQKKEYNHLKLYKMDKDKKAFKLIPKELSC